ncbi:MAG: ParB/RepB/Spo0J family partition protein [Tropheryma whipplei]|uniref:Chromosome partitioning protein ParB n=1 Tax=Tropheryma whipplei (strain Twist) TaxID=203267 RepID=Q83MN9_TROWT|nr:ParB/RepB/Spo0J family partition protein [Tropheryma whipplei]AAO44898.1 chromosome partitioning protein ParB [Tropheryma whipplei str. Twist]MCO8182754.1 ParB/RepB/Spo0J family partition protein [Tropheryma whipplei]MCO8190651.1 ParB/RepB/Spo0J family partition protein [Tropheryma whipplei]
MTSRRSGLGKGLDDLTSSAPADRGPIEAFFPSNSPFRFSGVINVPITDISPNPRQPRKVFDPNSLSELASSIKEVGFIQPIVVRKTKLGYVLVIGERRLRAAKMAGLSHVPAIVKTLDNRDMLRQALFENIHRAELNPIEEALAYSELLREFDVSQDELGQTLGKSRPYVTNTIRLLRLPPEVQDLLTKGKITPGHARPLLALENRAEMIRLAKRIADAGLSVRQAEALITTSSPKRLFVAGSVRKGLDAAAASLGREFDTKVSVNIGQRKGKIVIEFTTVADLRRILLKMGVPPSGL